MPRKTMTKKQIEIAKSQLTKLLDKFDSARDFARTIDVDSADVSHWKTGFKNINPAVVIRICREYDVEPQYFRPDIFPADVKISFIRK